MGVTMSKSDVRVKVEETARWGRRMAVEVTPDTVLKTHKDTVRAFARSARVKGYRKGKAPESLIERQYGPEIDQEVMKQVIQEGFETALIDSGLDPIVAPRFEGVRRTEQGGVEFEAQFDVRPEIELGRISGFRIDRQSREIGAEDVDTVLDRLRRQRSEWREVDRAARSDDRVVFDSVPIGDDGRPVEEGRTADQEAELGAEGLLPEFEVGLTDRSAGDEFTIDVTFPEQHPNATLRGSQRSFAITVRAVKERVVPGLDDAFAAELGDFGDVDSLREHIRANLEAELALEARREVDEALIDQIIDANAIDLPESMIDQYLANMLGDSQGMMSGDTDPEHLAEVQRALRPGAERALRRYYILNHIADREGLRATDEELDTAIADRIPSAQSVAEARRQLERSGELEDLRFHLTMERVFEWLRERSEISPALPVIPADSADNRG